MHTCEHSAGTDHPAHACPYDVDVTGPRPKDYCNCCDNCKAECAAAALDYRMFGNFLCSGGPIHSSSHDPLQKSVSEPKEVAIASENTVPLSVLSAGGLRFPRRTRYVRLNRSRDGYVASRYASSILRARLNSISSGGAGGIY